MVNGKGSGTGRLAKTAKHVCYTLNVFAPLRTGKFSDTHQSVQCILHEAQKCDVFSNCER